jgi:hypothetical protein
LLKRFFLGSGGGRKALYALSPKGALAADVPVRGPRRLQDALLVADYFVGHQLAVNGIYCALKYGVFPIPQVTFHRWLSFSEPVVPGISVIPDGYVEFITPAGIIACFLEVDLGHESQTIWKGKAEHYLQLAVSGKYREQLGRERFRVPFGRPSPRSRKRFSGLQRLRPSGMGSSRPCGTAPLKTNQHHSSRQPHEVLLPMRKDDSGGSPLLRNVRQIV